MENKWKCTEGIVIVDFKFSVVESNVYSEVVIRSNHHGGRLGFESRLKKFFLFSTTLELLRLEALIGNSYRCDGKCDLVAWSYHLLHLDPQSSSEVPSSNLGSVTCK